MMKLKDFNYKLPQHLIAQQPLIRRDQARLMIIDRTKSRIMHDIFRNIGNYLPKGSCIVVNDSKVVPARMLGKREGSGGNVEIFLLKKLSDGCSYETLMRPLRRIKNDDKIIFNGGDLIAQVKDRDKRIVRFNKRNLSSYLEKIGHMPLPPYIKRQDRASDRKDYQTVYADKEGSIASPTAGLHFTNRLMQKLERQGHDFQRVTLHINYATFKPVEVLDITQHKMHIEDYALTKRAFDAIKKAKQNDRPIVAVGTTSCRVLETVAKYNVGNSRDRFLDGSTDIFMYPGYRFRMTDILVTNFHLPHSTLLMLVYAFGGKALMAGVYREAIKRKYRFYSYGDAMMIL